MCACLLHMIHDVASLVCKSSLWKLSRGGDVLCIAPVLGINVDARSISRAILSFLSRQLLRLTMVANGSTSSAISVHSN